ncbi:energy-coupling factor ABC transporter ATP-binding protein [Leptotrichia sp. HSP-536]|uniref:Energy-coupling factor ABC transporter ATP-binding protein n=1 Tax=Leptotrichia alba TaxID=3239304 RepID=A0AB39V4Z4_9FUSO
MLRLENITFSYDEETEALKDVTLNIEKGKKTLFLGENGSGKSTLFLIMNGLLKAQKGNIYFEEKKIEHKKKNLEELRKKVGIIFQDPEIQIFAPLVFQEVAYGPENLGYSKDRKKCKQGNERNQYNRFKR